MNNKEAIERLKEGPPLTAFHEYGEAISLAIKALEERPTGEWVKVEDELPKDNFGCLVTVFETHPLTQEDFETVLPYFVGYDGETWNDIHGDVIPFEVVAWMRVPEPYIWKGQEE